MIDRVFKKISIANIKPEGFMRRQLEIQARGLTGNIKNIWEDLSDNSAWLGGNGEAWERGPYYLDGLIPLSILLGDETLKVEVKKWVDNIISSQQESGFFGPICNKDWWSRTIVLKALVPYYFGTRDERIIPFMDKYLEFWYKNIDKHPPLFWAYARTLEVSEAIEIVYSKTGKKYLMDLTHKLHTYMYDWFSYFNDLPYKKPMTAYMNRTMFNLFKNIGEPIERLLRKNHKVKLVTSADKILKFNNKHSIKTISMTHGVNIAMALKYPVTYGMIINQKNLYKLPLKGYSQIMKYHGTANGLWTSDEHLSGSNPSNGTELCTVVEMMYSLEEMLSITGETKYADLLELMAFNTLPATFTADMCSHQYLQQVNQIAADKNKRQYFDANSEANTYGLTPNFGCCAANMHQGFPKYVANSCYRSNDGYAFMVYSPCTINSTVRPDKKIVIRETTDYPYGDKIRFDILEGNDLDITLSFRIPAMTTGELLYNGVSEGVSKAGIVELKKRFNKGDIIELLIDATIVVVNNPDGSISIRKGSLLLALKIEEEYRNLKGAEPFNYREYLPKSDWNLAPLLSSGKVEVLEIIRYDIPELPFDSNNPPLEIKIRGVKVNNWKVSRNSAGPYPMNAEVSEPLIITLVPYGSTNIRVAQFPIIEEEIR